MSGETAAAVSADFVKAVVSALIEPSFVEQVHRLLDEKAGAFKGLAAGGEFGLACTEAHEAFKGMYEAKLDAELEANGSSREALVAFLDAGEENEGIYYLLDMLLSLDDFEHFVDLMIRRRDGKRVTLPVNLQDVQDITDLIFGYEEDFADEDGEHGEESGSGIPDQ